MSTNDETETEVIETEVSNTDLEAELRDAKAEAENKSQVEETEQVKPESVEGEQSPTLTTEVPSEHDIEWYKKAYEQSTKEALRLKGELDKTPPPVVAPEVPGSDSTPEQLYVKQMLTKESDTAFAEILEKYPQVKDQETYKRFSQTAEILSRTIVETEKRFPFAQELYNKTAVVMGLKPDTSEELGAAIKDSASASKTSSSTPSPAPVSKVSEDMIAWNLKTYPNKTRAEIIEELEPHIN